MLAPRGLFFYVFIERSSSTNEAKRSECFLKPTSEARIAAIGVVSGFGPALHWLKEINLTIYVSKY